MNQNRNWKKVIFSDESLFKLQSNRLKRWGKTRKFVNKSRFVPQVHIWGAISSRGTVGIYFLEPGKTIDSAFYCENILRNTLHHADELFGVEFTVQQDTAPPHVSAITKQRFADMEFDVLPWPALSPELSMECERHCKRCGTALRQTSSKISCIACRTAANQ